MTNNNRRISTAKERMTEMIKKTFDEFVEIVKTNLDDPLEQIRVTTYQVDGYIVRVNGGFVQWRTPVQTNFTFGLPAKEFLKQAKG